MGFLDIETDTLWPSFPLGWVLALVMALVMAITLAVAVAFGMVDPINVYMFK